MEVSVSVSLTVGGQFSNVKHLEEAVQFAVRVSFALWTLRYRTNMQSQFVQSAELTPMTNPSVASTDLPLAKKTGFTTEAVGTQQSATVARREAPCLLPNNSDATQRVQTVRQTQEDNVGSAAHQA